MLLAMLNLTGPKISTRFRPLRSDERDASRASVAASGVKQVGNGYGRKATSLWTMFFQISLLLFMALNFSSCDSRSQEKIPNKPRENAEIGDRIGEYSSDDINYIISLNEWRVISSWDMAMPKILDGSPKFKLVTEFGDVYFHRNESADGDLSYRVWGAIKGIIEIELGDSGGILTSVYRPWSDELTLMRTIIVLEDGGDIDF